MEDLMKQLWSRVLDTDAAEIQDEDDFFEMGGDSVKAIQLVAEAREQNIRVEIGSTFAHPGLSAMAEHNLVNACASVCHIDEDIIEDIIPSPYIQAMMLEGFIRTGSWSTQYVFQLIGDCGQDTLRKAWTAIHERNPVLRTRIVHIGKKYLQVVTKEAIRWFEGSDLQGYRRNIRSKSFDWGSPLFHYAIVSEGNSNYFVWTAHHSGFDGWTRNLIITDLAHILANNDGHSSLSDRLPYKSYVNWQLSLDSSDALSSWRKHLQGFNPKHLENLYPTSPSYLAVSTSNLTRCLPFSRPRSPFTLATMVNTAYALAIARISRLDDILFWAVRSGRQINLEGIESIMGPVLTGIPLRVLVHPNMAIADLMQELQRQTSSMLSIEPFALQALEEHIGHRNVIRSAVNYRPPGSDSLATDINFATPSSYLKPRKDLSTPRTTNLGLTTAVHDEKDHFDIIVDRDGALIQEL